MSPQQVRDVKSAGGRLIVMPHSDAEVIIAAKAEGMIAAPGIMTPTEAFAALKNGADALKLFPAEASPPKVLKAMLAVLPAGSSVVPVGGIDPDNLASYWNVGAKGFGLGSALYKPGKAIDDIAFDAKRFVEKMRELMAG